MRVGMEIERSAGSKSRTIAVLRIDEEELDLIADGVAGLADLDERPMLLVELRSAQAALARAEAEARRR